MPFFALLSSEKKLIAFSHLKLMLPSTDQYINRYRLPRPNQCFNGAKSHIQNQHPQNSRYGTHFINTP